MARPIDPQKRERILQTAIKLFTELGYNETTTALIAKHTDMSSAHMYIYFKNKRALLKSAIELMMAEHSAEVLELSKVYKSASPEEFIELCYKIMERIRPRALFIINMYVMPGFSDIFQSVDLDYSGVFRGYMADWREDIAESAARTLMALSDSYFLIGDLDRVKAASVLVIKAAKMQLLS